MLKVSSAEADEAPAHNTDDNIVNDTKKSVGRWEYRIARSEELQDGILQRDKKANEAESRRIIWMLIYNFLKITQNFYGISVFIVSFEKKCKKY